jgi:hypothetical protein
LSHVDYFEQIAKEYAPITGLSRARGGNRPAWTEQDWSVCQPGLSRALRVCEPGLYRAGRGISRNGTTGTEQDGRISTTNQGLSGGPVTTEQAGEGGRQRWTKQD